jgi:hypothetical protein
MSPVDLTLQNKIQNSLDNTYKDLSFFTLDKTTVESLMGKSVTNINGCDIATELYYNSLFW